MPPNRSTRALRVLRPSGCASLCAPRAVRNASRQSPVSPLPSHHPHNTPILSPAPPPIPHRFLWPTKKRSRCVEPQRAQVVAAFSRRHFLHPSSSVPSPLVVPNPLLLRAPCARTHIQHSLPVRFLSVERDLLLCVGCCVGAAAVLHSRSAAAASKHAASQFRRSLRSPQSTSNVKWRLYLTVFS